MPRSSIAPFLFAATLAVPPLTAQAPTSMPWPDQVLADVAEDGTLWAAAETWKASFAAGGATFHPFLGGDAAAAPASFALVALRCDGEPLPVRTVRPTRQRQRVTFDRGPVRECYDLHLGGIEQSFVFDTLPRRGALELDVAVATALTVATDEHGDGHTLLGPDGGMRYGRAIAIDAAGARCDVSTNFADGAFHLTVPASFVAAAALPLVVDPFVGTVGALQSSTGKALLSSDIAFDQSLGQFLVTFERAYSATDHDVYVAYSDTNMTPQGVLTIDVTADYWSKPRIAVLEAHDTACVVAETSADNLAPFSVKSRILLCGPTPLLQPVSTLGSGPGYDYLAPDIGGDRNPVGPSRFLVGFEIRSNTQSEGYLRCRRIDPLGTALLPNIDVHTLTGRLRDVAISRTCGTAGGGADRWGLLYRYEGFGQSIGELRFTSIDRGGSVVGLAGFAPWLPVGNITANLGSEWDISSPTDAATGITFLCAETRVDPVSGRGAIRGTVLGPNGLAVVPDTVLVGGIRDYRQPAVDSDGYRFVLAHTTVYSTSDHDLHTRVLSRVGSQLLTAAGEVLSSLLDQDTEPAICAAGPQRNGYALAWSHSDGTSWQARAQRYTSLGQGQVVLRNTGCAPISPSVLGNTVIGGSFTVGVTTPLGIAALLVGTPTTVPLPQCPGCTIGADGPLFVGNQVNVTVPTVPTLIGATVSFQAVQVDFAAASCLGLFLLGSTCDVTLL